MRMLPGDFEPPSALFDTGSPPMRAFGRMLTDAARHDAPVLLVGEGGTGKTTFASLLHALSPRAVQPFVRIDCSAAFDPSACAAAASKGTLFLDDVTRLPYALQGAALELLNELPRRDIRVVASAADDLDVRLANDLLRRDLFYRLSVLEIRIPPLRDRPTDILPLARSLVADLARKLGRTVPELSPPVERALVAYAWPGNVAELLGVIERMLILAPGSMVDATALPERMKL